MQLIDRFRDFDIERPYQVEIEVELRCVRHYRRIINRHRYAWN